MWGVAFADRFCCLYVVVYCNEILFQNWTCSCTAVFNGRRLYLRDGLVLWLFLRFFCLLCFLLRALTWCTLKSAPGKGEIPALKIASLGSLAPSTLGGLCQGRALLLGNMRPTQQKPSTRSNTPTSSTGFARKIHEVSQRKKVEVSTGPPCFNHKIHPIPSGK